jgi:hypothetical protein
MATFIVYNYEPEGGRAADFDEDRAEHQTLDEARADVRARLGDTDDWRRWGGHEDSPRLVEVEAYHESREPGCGGVHISTQA